MTDLLAAVAATGLPGGFDARWPAAPLRPDLWQALTDRVAAERLEGLLLAAIEDPGLLPATVAQHRAALDATVAACGLAVRLERRAADAVEALRAVDVETRVLKGTAVAHLDHVSPTHRHHGDVDLLVPTEAFPVAVATLRQHGWTRANPPTRPGWYRRFGKALLLRDHTGLEIDLHRTLADGAPGVWIVEADLWSPGQALVLDGRPAEALGLELRFVHACLHASLGAWPTRWSARRDVAQLGLDPMLDRAEVAQLARRWRASLPIATALDDAWAALRPCAAIPALAIDRRRPRAERVALERERDPRRGHRRRIASTFGALDGAPAKAAYARSVVMRGALARGQRRSTAP